MVLKKLLNSAALTLSAVAITSCGGGSGGSSVPPPPPPPPDNTAPTVSFSPATLTLESGRTGTSTLTATDNVAVTSGPTVSCTNGGSFAGGTFTAPNVTANTTVECTATAGDAAGNQGSGTLTVTVTPDTTPPVVTITPNTLSLLSGETAIANFSVTDSGGATTIAIDCSAGGTYVNGNYTAPSVTVATTDVCTVTATDTAGNVGDATLTVTVTPDTTPPMVAFNPATLTIASGETTTVTLTATDNLAVTSLTDSCTNGGNFTGDMFTAPVVTATTTVVCTATAMDGAGNSADATLTVTVTPPPAAVTIDGKITFDLVPFNTATNGLNYNAITREPAPGITVEAQTNAGAILGSDVTDVNGDYSFSITPNTDVRIIAKAEMVQTAGAQWNVQVIDNTSANALYQLVGNISTSGSSDSTRNLHASSGWGGSGYTSDRNAAPFAMLAPIYVSMQKIVAVDPAVVFPETKFNWSVNNRAANGNPANGEIGTSSYVGNGNIFILGDDNSDTDEYDDHVVIHEWGHYFEDQLSRSDSIGGSHSGGQRLDPRVAMGEGFGNALSGIMTDDPFYRDSNGNQQANGFSINVETNDPTGWYDESTVQSVLYDIYDNAADGDDTLALGLGPIYEALTASDYRSQSVFTTIYSFLAELRSQQAGSAGTIDGFAANRGINSTIANGAGETNNGSLASALPLYKPVTVNGPAVEICSVNDNGEYNKLGNRAYLSFLATSASHTFTMTRSSGAASRDPDFIVFKDGNVVGRAESDPAESESVTLSLAGGAHVIDAYDFFNSGQSGTTGDACYNFTITR